MADAANHCYVHGGWVGVGVGVCVCVCVCVRDRERERDRDRDREKEREGDSAPMADAANHCKRFHCFMKHQFCLCPFVNY